MLKLTDLQHDALVEIFNMGVGKAANALSSIVNEEVSMSVPTISFQNRAEAAAMLGRKESRRLCGIFQQYDGAFKTDAILMFPEEKSLQIVRMMVGDDVSNQELTDMEQEAMNEIGNIILNACIGIMANLFNCELEGTLPTQQIGHSNDILAVNEKPADDIVLMLNIDLSLEKHEIRGYAAFLLDMTSLLDLQHHTDMFLARISQ